MGSIDSYQGINPHSATTLTAVTSMSVQGFYTSASAIIGGVTTSDAGHSHGVKMTKTNGEETPPQPGDEGYCPGCGGHYKWDPSLNAGDGGWYCEICGCELEDGCGCGATDGYCRCPLDMNWGVVLFMVALATVYAYIKKTDLTPNSDVRNGRDMVA